MIYLHTIKKCFNLNTATTQYNRIHHLIVFVWKKEKNREKHEKQKYNLNKNTIFLIIKH